MTGTIIADVSDHFQIFILNGKNKKNRMNKSILAHKYSPRTTFLNSKNLLATKLACVTTKLALLDLLLQEKDSYLITDMTFWQFHLQELNFVKNYP